MLSLGSTMLPRALPHILANTNSKFLCFLVCFTSAEYILFQNVVIVQSDNSAICAVPDSPGGAAADLQAAGPLTSQGEKNIITDMTGFC